MRKMLSKSIWTSGCAPIRKRMKVKVHVFCLGHFAMSKIEFESNFPIKYYIRDIASLRVNLSLITVQLSPSILGQFCEKLIFCFFP